MTVPRRVVLGLAVSAALAAAPGAAAATGRGTASTVIVKARSGKSPVTDAVATVRAPIDHLGYSVEAAPAQVVTVDWSLLCQTAVGVDPGEGSPMVSRRGSVRGRAPLSGAFALPRHWRTCIASVYSTLSRSGKETVQLLRW
jgi:hypothetical protein